MKLDPIGHIDFHFCVFAKYDFEAAFNDKGRFESFMKTFPVHVIEDDYAALIGSANYLVDIMKDENPT